MIIQIDSGSLSGHLSSMNWAQKRWKRIIVGFIVLTLGLLVSPIFVGGKSPLRYKIDFPEGVQSLHFRKILGELMGPQFLPGNTINTLLNGDEIFPAMLKAIGQAQKTITFESYIYWSGQIGDRFANALAERAKNGVRVHVLIDWVGSQKIDADLLSLMTDAGVEVERYHPPTWRRFYKLNNRTHRKILVIDGKVGFTGGVGIADAWMGNGDREEVWRDTHYHVRGPVVAQMQSTFLDNWMKVHPEINHSTDYFPLMETVTGQKNPGMLAQMFKSTSREGNSSVRIMYLVSIAAAKHSIQLESAYFVPDQLVVDELIKAKQRGVDIEIIVPSDFTDSDIVQSASQDTWEELLNAGIKIYRFQKAMFHCKVLIVDRYLVSVGSTNFDERSFNLNDEANLNVLDKDFAEEQAKIFEADKINSKQVSKENWKRRSWWQRTAEDLAGIFASQF